MSKKMRIFALLNNKAKGQIIVLNKLYIKLI